MLLNKLIEDVLQRDAVQWITGMESGRCHACRSILHVSSSLQPYNFVFPSALAFAHLSLAAALSLDLVAGLLRRSFLAGLGVADVPLTFAHLALPAALIAALPAALIRLLPLLAGLKAVAASPLILAHLACCAAAILARTAADLRLFFGVSSVKGEGASLPAMESSWLWSASICSLMAMIWRSWVVVKFVRSVMTGFVTPGGFGVNHGNGSPQSIASINLAWIPVFHQNPESATEQR